MRSTLSNGQAPTQIFLAVSALALIWIFFINDYSQVEIQSPIKIGGVRLAAAANIPAEKEPGKKVQKQKKVDPLPETENDAAPLGDLPPADAKAYIQQYAGLAVEEMRRTGIPASISMAQALVESRAGRSGLALTANNHFGMKCHVKSKCKAGHCINFSDDSDLDYFLVFQNASKSWKAHSELLKSDRYKKCFGQISYEGWAKQLKKAGYATAPDYANTLISIIKRYKLDMLDTR